MEWRKMGHVFSPSGNLWWAKSYAHLPTAYLHNDDVIRVYFAALDEHKYGRIGFVDVAAENPKEVIHVSPEPVLDLGKIGTFEDCGVVPSCIIKHQDQLICYYHGFQRTHRIPYLIFSGVAAIDQAGNFQKLSKMPILDRTEDEQFLRGAPYVIVEKNLLRMWYVSCLHWITTGDKLHYVNVIRHASSTDGLNWSVDEPVCLEPNLPDEYSIGRPCVVKNDDGYEMWFSARSHSDLYKIGYASSSDGLHWTRADEQTGIGKSSEGWDSEIICYPNIVQVKNQQYMFYNGNSHGSSGFGYAVRKI